MNLRAFGPRQNRREEAGLSSHNKPRPESQKAGAGGGYKGGGQSGPAPGENGAPQPTLDKPEGARGGERRWGWHS